MNHRRGITSAACAGLLFLSVSCDRLPGKPKAEDKWVASSEVTDFGQLYSQNCAGCHGTDGRMGPARPLNDPLYLALAGAKRLREITANGVPETAMPAFAVSAGGNLTDQQIGALADGFISRWGSQNNLTETGLPPYSAEDAIAAGSGPGDTQRGKASYQVYCARCHGVEGTGGEHGGSIVDRNFLSLVSDQHLRTTVIVGRPDLGKPDWRGNFPDRPMSPQEISDVVAWLAIQRPRESSNSAEDQVNKIVATTTANSH
jgi:cytochrome c oxidase cbb3-type subunit 3